MQIQPVYSQKGAKPLVSFIVTYYNEPIEMLQQCIESIVALSLSPDEREIILIDDGSDLSPLDSIAQYREQIIYIRQPNKGLSMARNMGIIVATGQYLQFVDADDYFLQNAYEHTLDLVRYHNPDVVIFSFTSSPMADTPFILPTPISGTEYLLHNNLRAAVWSYVFRSNLLIGLKFAPELKAYCEDEQFTPQLILRAERVFVTEDKAYFYRKRKESIIHRTDNSSCHYRLDNMQHVIHSLYRLSQSLPRLERLALERRVHQLTMDYIYNIIRLTRSRHELKVRLDSLAAEGLFPLPEKNYTKKYKWFARLANSSIGRQLLFITILVSKKES